MPDFAAFPPDKRDFPSQAKSDLRRELLDARRGMSIQDRENQDEGVRAALVTWFSAVPPATVAAYVPMIGEPGGTGLPDLLAGIVEQVLLPVVLANRDLDWSRYGGPDALEPAGLGLTEPIGPRLGVDAVGGADLVIVPALAVDRAGMRLGRGGGSYDRALERVSAPQRVIALLYAEELLDHVPSEPHDRRIDGIVIDGRVMLLSL